MDDNQYDSRSIKERKSGGYLFLHLPYKLNVLNFGYNASYVVYLKKNRRKFKFLLIFYGKILDE